VAAHAAVVGMYLRTTQRRNRDGSVVRSYAPAENVRHPANGHVEAKVVHSFGRADRLDRAALERLGRSVRRVLDAAGREGRGLTFAPLRKRGPSKEGRDDDPQAIIALAVTRGGMPVRSWVLPGDTAGGATVERI
jgi:hypothetical protein